MFRRTKVKSQNIATLLGMDNLAGALKAKCDFPFSWPIMETYRQLLLLLVFEELL